MPCKDKNIFVNILNKKIISSKMCFLEFDAACEIFAEMPFNFYASSPAFHVQAGEGFQGSFTGEELKTTLCVFNPSHTEEPHQEVESIHQERSEQRPLSQEETEEWKCILMNINCHAPVFREAVLPEPLLLFPGELWIHRRSPCYPAWTHEKNISSYGKERSI